MLLILSCCRRLNINEQTAREEAVYFGLHQIHPNYLTFMAVGLIVWRQSFSFLCCFYLFSVSHFCHQAVKVKVCVCVSGFLLCRVQEHSCHWKNVASVVFALKIDSTTQEKLRNENSCDKNWFQNWFKRVKMWSQAFGRVTLFLIVILMLRISMAYAKWKGIIMCIGSFIGR